MKIPLSYQASEFDCGPTTLTNAISYLFNREEIPPDVIKHIVLFSLDAYNEKGEFGKSGTSGMAMMFLCNWLNQFGKVKHFPIRGEFLTGSDVFVGQNSRLVAGLQQGGVAVVRLNYGGWHYVLFTGVSQNSICMFDPYFRKKAFKIPGIEMVLDAPAKMNRKVSFDIFNKEEKGAYTLGPIDIREAVLLFNENTRQTPGRTIEYFI